MKATNSKVHVWSVVEWETVDCHVCETWIDVGVDAHDAGVDDRGIELFACPSCCEECNR